MKFAREIGITLLAIALTIIFEFVVLGATNPQEADINPNKVFAVQGDLLVAALSILVGAQFAANRDRVAYLNPGFTCLAISFVVVVALSIAAGRSWSIVKQLGDWLSLWIPDIFAAVTVLVSIHCARKAYQ